MTNNQKPTTSPLHHLTISDLRSQNLILFESISGSQAYNLATPTSDTDIKGVYILPKTDFYGLTFTEQVNNETNDIVFYELRKFIDLLNKNNPSMLELLGSPEECILKKHPVMDKLKPELFLSKLCKDTFAGYAQAQIKRARGLNKKIVNPISEERKNILDFCYINWGQGSKPLTEWLRENNMQQEFCGLSSVPHMANVYGLYYDNAQAEKTNDNSSSESYGFRGIMRKENSNEVSLSSIPKALKPRALMYFNKDGYTKYCKDYREYWDWVEKRNEARYSSTIEHGKNYDAKNMMHTFRLLDMAEEIARYKKLIVKRPNREYLLRIRNGEFSYEELVEKVSARVEEIEEFYDKSDLPDKPDFEEVNKVLVEMREEVYAGGGF